MIIRSVSDLVDREKILDLEIGGIIELSRDVTLTQQILRQVDQTVFQVRRDLFLKLYSPMEGAWSNLYFLQELPSVRHLILADRGITNLTPLSLMPNLKSIFLGCNQDVDIRPITEIPLKSLMIDGKIPFMNFITKFESLEFLEIHWHPTIQNINFIENLTYLAKLVLKGCDELIDIGAIANTNIESLSLLKLCKLEDISAIEQLKSLKFLEIAILPKLKDKNKWAKTFSSIDTFLID